MRCGCAHANQASKPPMTELSENPLAPAAAAGNRRNDITAALKRMAQGPLIDLGSAHYQCFDAHAHVPAGKLSQLPETRAVEDVISQLVRRETSVELNDYSIRSCNGSARVALGVVFDHFLQSRKPIALPVPNWHFWKLKNAAEQPYSFTYLSATREDELVESFAQAARKTAISALLLSSPVTPIGYSITTPAARELAGIARQSGIAVIVDDIRRGSLPLDQRDSIARHFDRPFIVEGLGHRLGEHSCGALSYVLVPNGVAVDGLEALQVRENVAATAMRLQLAIEYGSQPALDEIRMRNEALDDGLRETAPGDVTAHRTGPTQVTTLLTLPPSYPIDATEFAKRAWFAHGNMVIAPAATFYPPEYPLAGALVRSFRVSVGKMAVPQIHAAARALGRALALESKA
jgi:aspartate/methionine/tyrosine aminotransferase